MRGTFPNRIAETDVLRTAPPSRPHYAAQMTDDHAAGLPDQHPTPHGSDGNDDQGKTDPGHRTAGPGPAAPEPGPPPSGPHASEAAGGESARRPRSTDPRELGFTPRKPVPWLAPLLLISTGLRTLLALLFGAYLDKRELQHTFDATVTRQVGPDGGLWLDYVADLGDGFNATYSVAYLLAQRELTVDGHRLPRAQVLVLGGDQVYPSAAFDTYEERCKGPYQAALPVTPPEQPTLFAIPGNHDWYDGLTAFLRLFVRSRDRHFGGWNTAQTRSYFAVELPADWWLFGLDDQSGSYLDDPQLSYFDSVAERLGPQSRVILAVPMPTWVKATTKDPSAYDSIDYFIRTIVAPTGAQVHLLISGDHHHYARYVGPDRQLITCGGGGAYLYPTHLLPQRIEVPPKETLARRASAPHSYELVGRYPDAAQSRRYAWGIFPRLPRRNPGFATLLGALYTLLILSMVGVYTNHNGTQLRLFSVPLVAMLLVTLTATVLFAEAPGAVQRRLRHWLLGLGHGLAHLGLAAAGTWVWLALPFHDWPWPLSVVAAAVFFGSVGGLVASQLVAAYLLVASAFGVNGNELFAGQGIEDSKGFVRMRIAPDGTLTIYPIVVDRVGRHWQVNPDQSAEASWLVPRTPLEPRLAEPPVILR